MLTRWSQVQFHRTVEETKQQPRLPNLCRLNWVPGKRFWGSEGGQNVANLISHRVPRGLYKYGRQHRIVNTSHGGGRGGPD